MKFILLLLLAALTFAATPPSISPSDPRLQIIGRVDRTSTIRYLPTILRAKPSGAYATQTVNASALPFRASTNNQ